MITKATALWFALFQTLAAQAPGLTILSAGFQQFEDGPPIPGKAVFQAGESLFFSCQISGYKVGPKDMIGLEWTVEVLDERNVLLTKPESKKLETDVSPEDKEWKPKIRFQFETPAAAQCTECVLKLKVSDKLSGATASIDKTFAIKSRKVEASETLVVRNFRFLRGESDGAPLPVAAYRSGDELWARFEITGYRFGEGNQVNVEYGLSVYRPSGKLLYQELKAAKHEERTFYPKRYVEGILNLKLQGLPAGEYPLLLEVRDEGGKQKYEARFPFRVE